MIFRLLLLKIKLVRLSFKTVAMIPFFRKFGFFGHDFSSGDNRLQEIQLYGADQSINVEFYQPRNGFRKIPRFSKMLQTLTKLAHFSTLLTGGR